MWQLKESVILLGFMSGVGIAVGVDPDFELTKAYAELIDSIKPGSGILLWMIPLAFLCFSILATYRAGGRLGLLATFIAFIGGVLIICSPVIGFILLAAGMIVGWAAFQRKLASKRLK